jgi:hypothetical protein
MNVDKKNIEVRISKRVLWVGSSAYPLSMVTNFEPVEFTINHWRVLVRGGRRAGAVGALGFFLMLLLSCGNAPEGALWVVLLATLAAFVSQIVVLVRNLARPPIYALRVQLAGSSRTAVASQEKAKIDDLFTHMADALDNPALEYAVWIENVNGDVIGGDKIGGDKVGADKTVYTEA